MPRTSSKAIPTNHLGWYAPGFKLAHLLAILGGIGIAVSLIIPAVAKSRERARSAVCRTNLAALAGGLHGYTVDFGGFLPYEDRGEEKTAGRICWFDAIDPYLTKAGVPPKEKVCPSVSASDPASVESYKMNSKLTPGLAKPGKAGGKAPAPAPVGAEPPPPYRKLATLPRPQATVLLFDADIGGKTVSFKGRWRDKDDDVNYRHNNATNILFADWHVEETSKDTLKKRSIHNTPIIWQPADAGPWDPMEKEKTKEKAKTKDQEKPKEPEKAKNKK
jgi:prepilin-type processing-associated H-X9-DG protein